MPIPARFIQTFHSEYAFGEVYANCRSSLRSLHPRWDLRFFADARCRRFIQQRRPELLELYDFYPRPVQRADLFRVLAVHQLGGFYMDLDVYLFRALDPLRNAKLVLAEEWCITREAYISNNGRPPSDSRHLFMIGNYGFASIRDHWFLEEVIREMVRRAEMINPSSCSNDDVIRSTGPDVFTAVYHRHMAELATETIILKGQDKPPEPLPRATDAEPWWFQFGVYGNHLMTSVWRE